MNEKKTTSRAVPAWLFRSALVAWAAGRLRESAASRKRWVQIFMTIALLLTGVVSWALALVQPWTSKPRGDQGLVAVSTMVDTDKVRQATADIEKFLRESTAPPPKPLRWDPFRSGHTAATATAAAPDGVQADRRATASESAEAPTPPSTPEEMLEALKNLKLEVTLVTPTGQRWAVINGKNYRVGDAVAGMEIIEIQENRVKLQQGGVTCLLRID